MPNEDGIISEVYSFPEGDNGEEPFVLSESSCVIPKNPDFVPFSPATFVLKGVLMKCGKVLFLFLDNTTGGDFIGLSVCKSVSLSVSLSLKNCEKSKCEVL